MADVTTTLRSVPRIRITYEAWRKMTAYIRHCNDEIQGFGIFESDLENLVFTITDVLILKQVVGPASAEIDGKDVADFFIKLIENGGDSGKVKCHWHSHVNMQTFWSSTDTNCAHDVENDYLISIVANKSHEYRVKLDIFKPVKVTIDNLKLEPCFSDDQELEDQIKAEIKEKVTSRGYGAGMYPRWNKTWNSHFDDDDRWPKKTTIPVIHTKKEEAPVDSGEYYKNHLFNYKVNGD
jgi:hypothetical protein